MTAQASRSPPQVPSSLSLDERYASDADQREGLILCADVGGSYIDVALLDTGATVLERYVKETPRSDWLAFLQAFEQAATAVLPTSSKALIPISIATAGLVDPRTGIVTAANIPAINGRPLSADLAATFGTAVYVINDADAFTLAEARVGVGVGHACVLGVVLGTGVGGGIVRHGELVEGPGGSVGEWGHGQIIHDPPQGGRSMPLFRCTCGRMGCLETVSGARGLERLHRFLHATSTNSRNIIGLWLAGDPAAAATIDYFVEITGGAIAMLVNTLGATVVPVGGGLSSVDRLVERLDAHVRKDRLIASAGPIVRRSALAPDGGLIGAYLNRRSKVCDPTV